MKTGTKIIAGSVAVASLAGLKVFYDVNYGTKRNIRYIEKKIKPLRKTKPRCEYEDDGSYALIKDKYDTFKILQLSDMHIGGGWLSVNEDQFAIDTISELVHKTQPDLVVITGDLVYSRPKITFNMNNLNSMRIIAKLMEKLDVWYTVTFGNHDAEYFATHTRSEVKEFFMNQRHCLLTDPNPEVTGESNHIVKIRNDDGTLNNAMIMIDSNSYPEAMGKGGYDCIHDDQVEWYETQMNKLKEEENGNNNSLLFTHIPLKEYSKAWKLYKNNNDKVKYFIGNAEEKISYSKYASRIFDVLLECGGTKGIFCGHDHLNDFSIEYKGIRLTYSKSLDCLLYAKNLSGHRGGTVIELDYDGTFTVEHISNKMG
ncbi:MAG: hypothetical protein E7270_06860 [Lachnospiraceae bacterium]|nr:hypothetical protein [Lachnospiraceae bacterium]